MNFMKYDYYGNYEEKSDNNPNEYHLFNIHDIHRKQKEREGKRTNIYKSIAIKCFKKIKETSENEITYCFFKLPEYIAGLPLYNMTECVMFILNLLHEKGFKARYVDPYLLFISWNLPKPNLKLIEPPKEEPPKKSSNIIEQLNLKYKPIEKYQAFSNFLPPKR